MYHREWPITPTQAAVTGAMDIFVEGCRRNNPRQQLFGLSVLREATAPQVMAAMPLLKNSVAISPAEILGLLAR